MSAGEFHDLPPTVVQPGRTTPDLRGLVERADKLSATELLALVRADQDARWRRAERPLAETYLEKLPALRDDENLALDLIYSEVLLREAQGEKPRLEEYAQRFPHYADLLARQFAVHQLLNASNSIGSPGIATLQRGAQDTVNAATIFPEQGKAADDGKARVPGYEILEELGRGGMGVVYKARQISLKRLVALKMILAGSHAAETDRFRFRNEAEAVARLQHPNIVQIHEIGEQGGLPYFSLEFVEGGSLDRKLRGQPLPIDEAGRLTATLARAMHHAHQRSVVHRDLKPANVLLMSDGTPKITDFGLARQLESDSGQTRSGAVMGTPSYMAPEQAAGQTRVIGPASDIYALGAILYECLTGRPPFQAPTLVELLERVRTAEVVPPSKVNPRVPHDLETICLKALAKEPERRYSSALMLAQDLERFEAGEPILARRETIARKVWRKLKRHRVATVLVLLALGIISVAGSVAVRALRDSEEADRIKLAIAPLMRDIDAGLQKTEPTRAYLEQMEARIGELQPLDAALADGARGRLYQSFARALRDSFSTDKKPALQRADRESIEAALQLLAVRDVGLEKEIRAAYRDRLSLFETFTLQAPFSNRAAFFDPAVVRVDGAALGSATASTGAAPLIPTRLACQGNLEMEAEFTPESWEAVAQLGVVLNASTKQQRGYAFLLTIPESSIGDFSAPRASTLGEAARKHARLRLEILRNGVRQREQLVHVEPGPLRLLVTRQADLLTVQVNQEAPVQVRDAFPTGTGEAGVFGLRWPAPVRLARLQVRRQAVPAEASPLEQGDVLYGRGQFSEALVLYRSQAEASRSPEIKQEARCKQARCLVDLQRLDEAAQQFEQLANEPGTRWPPWAACQLWVIRLAQNRPGESEAIFATLAQRYSPAQLAVLVSADLRQAIWKAYYLDSLGHNLLKFIGQPERAQRFDQSMAVLQLVADNGFSIGFARYSVAKAYRCAGRLEPASLIFAALVQGEFLNVQSVEEYAWLLRECGNTGGALTEIERHLADGKGGYRPEYLGLLLERARLHASQQKWEQAEKDLDELFKAQPEGRLAYRHHAGAALLRGFLRERRGDAAGAMEAWRQGVYTTWQRARQAAPVPIDPASYLAETDNTGVLCGMILASLTQELKDAEAEAMVTRLLSGTAENSPVAFLKSGYAVPPVVLREMWLSPRGRTFARKIAFEELSYAEFVRVPVVLLAFELARRGALLGELSTEQDAVLWQVAEHGFTTLISGKFGSGEGLKLALAWKGYTNAFGWKGLAPTLEPSFRGPLAYVLGHRYEKVLKKPEDVVPFFRTARDDAAADSPLRRLAEAELERLKKP
jgi:serine/threonine-protein kinase